MSIDNPFYHRGAIRRADDFFGRSASIAEILGLLRNGQSASIIGPRRIGKSSLLLHLCREEVRKDFGLNAPNALFILVDCQELGGSPPEEVYDALYSGVVDSAEQAGIDLPDNSGAGTYRTLDRALNRVAQAGTNVVVLLDEFELLAANEQLGPYFFSRLRGLTTKYGLAYITASQRPLYAITADEQVLSSPFFNIFVTLQLGLFTQTEAAGLLTQRLENSSIQFESALNAYLIKLVGPHPFFLHIAGYHAFQAQHQSRVLPLMEDEAQLQAIDTAIEIESESHQSYHWNNLTSEEQYMLATLEGPIDIVRMLEQQCLIVHDELSLNYASVILRRFVRRQQVTGLVQAGPFVIDPQRHQMKAERKPIPLTNSQFALMTRLGKQFGQVVHGEDLEIAVWGEVLVDDPDRLKTLIKRLRRAIEPYSDWIVSERGVGYALRAPA